MVTIGTLNTLEIVKSTPQGLYLDGDQYGEVLLPNADVTESMAAGDKIEVFLYKDSYDRLICTTKKPYAMAGEFATLRVKDLSDYGAFLEWGLLKDLFIHTREQKVPLSIGMTVVVYIYVDPITERLAASSKISNFLEDAPLEYSEGMEIDIRVYSTTPRGFKVIVNNKVSGSIYSNEIFTDIKIGDCLKGYIKKIRDDKTVDCILQKTGVSALSSDASMIFEKLEKAGGFLPVSDSSEPGEIYDLFGLSKKAFKRAIGTLFKAQKISIGDRGINLKQDKCKD